MTLSEEIGGRRSKRASSRHGSATKKKPLSKRQKFHQGDDKFKKNRHGKIVSKKRSQLGKERSFPQAVKEARKQLKLTGFVPVGGRSAEGQKLLKLSRKLHEHKTSGSSYDSDSSSEEEP